MFLTQKYSLFSTDQIEEIRWAGKNLLGKLSEKLDIPVGDLEDIWGVVSKMKDYELRILPQYQSAQERDEDNGGEPLNAVDTGYHLAVTHLIEEIDNLLKENN